jgi:[protein-PII] uridylyltransferase
MLAATLREHRRRLDDDSARRGAAYGQALAAAIDDALQAAFADAPGCAVVALGSYARGELCPGSDLDVLLVLPDTRRWRRRVDHGALAERLWYPLWDAGFTTGHAARSVRESLALADVDLDALTALLEVRFVAGDAELAAHLAAEARALCVRRRDKVVAQLADGVERRRSRPGPVAEMLEPNLKEGAGGLRDVHALGWAGTALGTGPGGIDALVAGSLLGADDAARVKVAADHLLALRVELHRVNGGKSDLLVLQDHDAVAQRCGAVDADAMIRTLASRAREVSWVVGDVLRAMARDDRRIVDRPLTPRLVVRSSRIHLDGAAPPAPLDVLEAAAQAAELDVPIARATLAAFGAMAAPDWDVWQRAAFGRLLRQGARAVPVFEALDHAGVLVRILPEWTHVRSLPQRNAYHRFTVDRHLLEAVSQCAALLDLADAPLPRPFDGVVARACRRPELLLLAALLHDIGKGMPDDHSIAGAGTAERVARRIGLDSEGVEILVWLVRHHLVMADTAVRRDLSDDATVRRFAGMLAGDGERLRLLYLLTIGDSIATGPAAWNRAKAALVRDLFVKAAAVVESDGALTVVADRRVELADLVGEGAAAAFLAVMPASYPMAFEPEDMVEHRRLLATGALSVACREDVDGRVVVTVVAPDRAGLLATVAGALTICGLAVHEASLFSTSDGMALEVFRADDTFGRFAEDGEEPVVQTLRRALAGELDLAGGVDERRRYHSGPAAAGPVAIALDLDASEAATVIEVHCDDRAGLLYELASTMSSLGLDVTVAKVQTLAERVVDSFYVRDEHGKITDLARLTELEAALRARLA